MGTLKATASLGIKETYTGKICEAAEFQLPLGIGSLSWAGMACPVAVGPNTVGTGVKLASALPATLAQADVSMTAVDQDGEQALCVNIHLNREAEDVPVQVASGKLALTWEDCGDASTHGHTDDVQPTEIVIGQDNAITGTGSTDKAISSGSFTLKATASLGTGVKLASALPVTLAQADVSMTAVDQDGEQALCVNIHLNREFTIV